jgi:hypothetical protein
VIGTLLSLTAFIFAGLAMVAATVESTVMWRVLMVNALMAFIAASVAK